MSNLYVAEATVKLHLGSRTGLLDRDGNGSEDSGLLARIIESMGRLINMRLKQRYGSAVPFAEITDTPATPEGVQEIALHLVLWDLHKFSEPNGNDAQQHWELANATLNALLEGDFDLNGVARAGAGEGKYVVVSTYEDPVLSGVDSDDADRLRGV